MTEHEKPATGWSIPPFLRGLSAIALARLTVDGRVLDANLGFWRMVGSTPLPAGCGVDVADRFVNPPFDALSRASRSADDGAILFEGLITLGDPGAFGQTLRGAVIRDGAALAVVAEHDIVELERLSAELARLNGDLAEAQRALTRQNREIERSRQAILESARTDPLTGAANRRRMDERLREELDRGRRSGNTPSLVLADVDHFKRVNDDFGHPAGDAVLKTLVRRMCAATRPYDVVARWGGEEFVILLPDTDMARAVEVAERVRVAFAAESPPGVGRPVTASFGVASALPDDTAETLVARADAALYRAKEAGRNRVCGD